MGKELYEWCKKNESEIKSIETELATSRAYQDLRAPILNVLGLMQIQTLIGNKLETLRYIEKNPNTVKSLSSMTDAETPDLTYFGMPVAGGIMAQFGVSFVKAWNNVRIQNKKLDKQIKENTEDLTHLKNQLRSEYCELVLRLSAFICRGAEEEKQAAGLFSRGFNTIIGAETLAVVRNNRWVAITA